MATLKAEAVNEGQRDKPACFSEDAISKFCDWLSKTGVWEVLDPKGSSQDKSCIDYLKPSQTVSLADPLPRPISPMERGAGVYFLTVP